MRWFCYKTDDTDSTTYPGVALEDSDTACMTDADGDGYGDANPENENVEPVQIVMIPIPM